MKHWIEKENGIRMCEPDCVDEWLFSIWAKGSDYDGCNSVDDLKRLVDELVNRAEKARECLWTNHLFGIYGSPSSQEEIVGGSSTKEKSTNDINNKKDVV